MVSRLPGLPSFLPPAVLETIRNFGLSCQSVTSRGDLATCPAGEYRSSFSRLSLRFPIPSNPFP